MYCLGQEYCFVAIPCSVCIHQQLSQVYIECIAVIPYTGEFIVMCIHLIKVLVMLMLEHCLLHGSSFRSAIRENLCQVARDT